MYKLPLFYKILNLEENKELKQINAEKILILTEENLHKILKDKIFVYLKKLSTNIKIEYILDNTLENAFKISHKIIEENYDMVIGVGGGKILDISKYVAYISKIDYIAIPTTIANDGLASPISVLKDENKLTRSLGSKIPLGILIDLETIMKAPKKFIKAGIGDILSNYTSLYDWKLSNKNTNEPINDFAYLLSKTAFNSIIYMKEINLENKDFVKKVCEAIILSGISMEIAGTSRPCSGSEHLFSHYIDYSLKKENLHGYQVALGAVTSAFLQSRDYKMLLKFLKELEIDIRPSSLQISKKEFSEAWLNCKPMRSNRFTILDTIHLTEEKLNEIYNIIEEELK